MSLFHELLFQISYRSSKVDCHCITMDFAEENQVEFVTEGKIENIWLP